MEIQPIAYAQNGFVDKFGIPRQSQPDSVLLTRIVFTPEYSDPNAFRGLEGYSHLWLIWEFHDVNGKHERWSPTVRPPRLGGNIRMGVFATRSPNRPNRLGMSSVELLSFGLNSEGRMELVVRGADMMNGTPIYDVKPYLSFSDSHPEARNGFAGEVASDKLQVASDKWQVTGSDWEEICEILGQNPVPGYQNDPERIYKLDYKQYHIEFRHEKDTIYVVAVHRRDGDGAGND